MALKASKWIDAFCCILMVNSVRWRCAPCPYKGMVSNQTERLSNFRKPREIKFD